ncbi:MAG: pre-peptidase C-terminal domain-containing protein [Anaerolineales bacterium]|nr:pre-peptidase C-terminal domain-containing protein [Anaerolineales bacterium]
MTLKDTPYIGPQTFTINEKDIFFGRDSEARDLLALVSSQRCVLFYAQSGAGKSSLINTRLIPGLEGKGFEVLPVGRVSGESNPVAEVDNLFVYNLLLTLDQGKEIRDAAQDQALRHKFTQKTLVDFLNHVVCEKETFYFDDTYQYPSNYKPKPRVLIIDQFEEILNAHLNHSEIWKQRTNFFEQLSLAMQRDRWLWVVLSLREDYVAGLDPYAHHLPGGLKARYYMQRMNEKSALEAIMKPVEEDRFGWKFDLKAAEELSRNLRQIHTTRVAGEAQQQIYGEFVEPVQLQVVCLQLWNGLNKSRLDKRITLANLEDQAKKTSGQSVAEFVDTALRQFYDEAINALAEDNAGRTKFDIRYWFENELITPSRIRNLVSLDGEKVGTLDQDLVERLGRDYLLVRREIRSGGSQWYELAHERFIEPILQSNIEWQKRHPLIQAARAWELDKNAGKLYQGHRLAEAWQDPDAKLQLVKRFLEASKSAEIQRQKERKMAETARINQILWLAVIATLITLGIAGYYWWRNNVEKTIAKQQTIIAQQQTELAQQQAEQLEITNQQLITETNKAKLAEDEALVAEAKAEAALTALEATNMFEAGRYETGLLLSLEALKISSDTVKAQDVLLRGLQRGRLPLEHDAAVRAVAFNPNRETMVSADDKGTLKLWNASSRTLSQQIELDDKAKVTALAFAPDGQRLVVASCTLVNDYECNESKLTVWNPTRDSQTTLLTNTTQINSVAFSPDGAHVAGGDADGIIWVWNAAGGQELHQLTGHTNGVNSVAFSPDGAQIVSGSADSTVRLWDVATGEELHRLAGHTGWVNSVAFSPDGAQIISGGDEGLVQVWDVATGEELHRLAGHTNWVNSVAFSPDGAQIVSGSADRTVRLWDAATGQELQQLVGHTSEVNSVAFSLDGAQIISGANDRTVRLWNPNRQENLGQRLGGHGNEVSSVAFYPNENEHLLASGSCNQDCSQGEIRWWHESGELRATWQPAGLTDRVNSLAFDQNGEWLASSTENDPDIHLYQIKTTPILTSSPPITLSGHSQGVNRVVFSPDGTKLASMGQDNQLILWENWSPHVISKPLTSTLAMTNIGDIKDIAFDPDSSRVAAVMSTTDNKGSPSYLVVWHFLASGKIWSDLVPGLREGTLSSLSFSPDGEFIFTGTDQGNIVVWDAEKLQPIGQPYPGHSGPVRQLIFGPDKNKGRLISAAADGLILWQLEAEKLQRVGDAFKGDPLGIRAAVFNAQGTMLASAGQGGNLELWSITPAAWVTQACALAGRNLTYEEWGSSTIGQEPESRYHKTCDDFDVHPSVVEAWVNQGQQYLLNGYLKDEADKSFKSAVAFKPGLKADLATMSAIGDLMAEGRKFIELNKYDQALASLNQAVALDPEFDLMNQKQPLVELYENLCTQDLEEACSRAKKLVQKEIQLGQIMTGTITSVENNQIWIFKAGKDQTVTISMNKVGADSALDTYLTLKDETGDVLTRIDDFEGNLNARIDGFSILADQTYQIEASAYAGIGNYTLSVAETHIEPIAFGEQKQAKLQDDIRWTFEGQPDDVVSIVMRSNSGNINPWLTLWDANGYQVDSYSASSLQEARIKNRYPLSDAGPYTIRARADRTEGAYTLTLVKQTDAGELQLGDDPQSGTLEANGIDAWQFEAESGRIIAVNLVAQSDTFQPRLTLLDAYGDKRLEDDGAAGAAGFNYYIPETNYGPDTYTLLVEGMQGSEGRYTLGLQPEQPNRIEIGDRVTATAKDGQLWTFDGQAGQQIRVTLSPSNDNDAALTAYDQTGQELAFSDTNPVGPGAAINRLALSETGPYTLTISADSLNTYDLHLTELQPEGIQFDNPVFAELEDNKVLTFTGQPGQVVNIDLVGSQQIELALLGPANEPVASTTESSGQAATGASSLRYTRLPAAGPYTIVPIAAEETGIYKLSFKPAPVETLAYGTHVTGSLESGVIWQFEGEAGQVIAIETDDITSGATPSFELWRSSGEDVAERFESSLSYYSLPASDTYTIIPKEPTKQGDYGLLLRTYPIESIAYGAVVTGNLAAKTLWQFEAEAGDIVSIAMDDVGSGIDPVLKLKRAIDDVSRDDDSGGNGNALIRRLRFDTPGLYTIIPQDYSGAATGGYTLTLEVETPVGTIEIGASEPGQIQPNSSEAWTFAGQAGDIVAVTLAADSPELTPKVTLFDSSGSVMAEAEVEDNRLTTSFEFYFFQTDSYTFVVEGDKGQSGPYTLTVEPKTAAPIEIGETHTSNVAETATWTLSSQTGELVDIELQTNAVENYVRLKLYGPDGDLMAENDGVDRTTLRRDLASKMDYTLVINASDAEPYTLAIRPVETKNLSIGEPTTAAITDSVLFTFEAEVGDLVTVAMTATNENNLDTRLTLTGPDGNEVASNDDSPAGGTNSLIRNQLITTGGRYIIVPDAYSGSGTYTISLSAGQLDPNDAAAYYKRAKAYVFQEDYEAAKDDYPKAAADLQQVIDLAPDDYDNHNALCWAGSLLGHAAEVMPACERAVELAPDQGDAHGSRGLARALTGDRAGASADFRLASDWWNDNDPSRPWSKLEAKWADDLDRNLDINDLFNEEYLSELRFK